MSKWIFWKNFNWPLAIWMILIHHHDHILVINYMTRTVYWGLVNLSRQILGQSFVRSEIAQFRPKHAFEAFRFPTALENICKLWQFPIVLLSTETPEPLFHFQQCSIGKRVSHCRRSKYQAFALFLVWAWLSGYIKCFLEIKGWWVCCYFRLKPHFHI